MEYTHHPALKNQDFGPCRSSLAKSQALGQFFSKIPGPGGWLGGWPNNVLYNRRALCIVYYTVVKQPPRLVEDLHRRERLRKAQRERDGPCLVQERAHVGRQQPRRSLLHVHVPVRILTFVTFVT